MRDPLIDLRDQGAPIDPHPAFAAELRARLERALALPKGVTAVTTLTETEPATPTTRSAVVPYVAVDDARRAIEWYADVFGAALAGEPIVMPDGRIGHAELILASGAIYLADAHPEIGVTAPRPGEATVSLMLPVDDADEVRRRALAAGASTDREPYDGYGQRNAWIIDPFNHRWGLHSPLRTPDYRHGDLTHVSVRTPDPAGAAEFYRAVVGWEVVDDRVPGATPSVGVWASAEPMLLCVYAVDDLADARARVVAAGGTAGEPRQEPYGLRADCTDDQGTAFAIHEVAGGTERPPAHGRRAGDLAYLTLEVVDSAKARAFYGAVLGWTFTPGRVADGWQVEDTAPMTGLSGGHSQAAGIPMWRVADIDHAVAAVRAAGGTATDPEQQPYGTTSECVDDQGTRFYLGQL
ncbi:MAG TPA: VOC family protein [Jatrophihabitans sp.]|nr:VOC family protein [Jatrophihabitans sp.]